MGGSAGPVDGEDLPPVWTIAGQLGLGSGIHFLSMAAGSLGPALIRLPSTWQPMRWVTLDPTPAGSGLDDGGPDSFFGQARQQWDAILKALLLAYNKDSREQAAETLAQWVTQRNGGLYLAGGALGVMGLAYARRRVKRRRTEPASALPLYVRRLSAILARAGYTWPEGQTAREFARAAGAALRLVTATANLAHVPEQIVAAYYAERFGQRMSEAERFALDLAARELDVAL